ncbi:hypothetical protein [Streptomyces sp. NPDC002690]
MTARTAEENTTMTPDIAPPRRRAGALATLLAAAALTLTGCAGTGDLVSYDLPAKAARYSFEAETDGVTTRWEYVSDRPGKDDAPELTPCMGDVVGDNRAACRPEPLIFLRYDFDLALDNTARSGENHRIKVTGYYQDRLSTPPKLTSLKAQVTYDGGRTWQPAAAAPAGANTYTVTLRHPKGELASHGVGLRVDATDSKGDTVRQTLPTAYRLR